MQLRPYQENIKRRCYRDLSTHKNVMLQLPTGAGKTVLFSSITSDAVSRQRRVMILVHRRELIEQSFDKLKNFGLGARCGVILSGQTQRYFQPVQIASIQTLIQRSMPPKIDLIVVDEAHHAVADSYRRILGHYPDAWVLGVTATPCRTNGQGFADMFSSLITADSVGASTRQLIEQKFLVAPTIYSVPFTADLSRVKKRGGDYNEKQLAQIMDNSALVGELVESWRSRAFGRRTVTFAVNIEHSMHIVQQYEAAGIPAAHIDGSTPTAERQRILRDFREGRFLILSNVGIVTEGFDVPQIECVQLVRPTKSLSLYLQMVGRGLRPADGKSGAIILDHANCIAEHGFPQEDRDWTLDGVSRKSPDEGGSKIKAKCLETGKLFPLRELPPHVREFELVEVRYSEEAARRRKRMQRSQKMRQLLKAAQDYGYKPGWAWFRFLRYVNNRPTVEEIELFAELAEFEKAPGWIYHKKGEFGFIPGYQPTPKEEEAHEQ